MMELYAYLVHMNHCVLVSDSDTALRTFKFQSAFDLYQNYKILATLIRWLGHSINRVSINSRPQSKNIFLFATLQYIYYGAQKNPRPSHPDCQEEAV